MAGQPVRRKSDGLFDILAEAQDAGQIALNIDDEAFRLIVGWVSRAAAFSGAKRTPVNTLRLIIGLFGRYSMLRQAALFRSNGGTDHNRPH